MTDQTSNFREEFYKRLIVFAVKLVKFCSKLRKDRDFWVIADQLLDSGTSVGANVAEAKSASSKRDYVKFFEISLKSANETIYWLTVIIFSKKELAEEAGGLRNEVQEFAKIIASGILTMKGKKRY